MSDSSDDGLSDLDDIDDLEMIMQQVQSEQEQEEEEAAKRYPTIMLEAVASYDLWIWYAFFGVAGANNDLTVLNNSLLFDDLLDDVAPMAPFECNGVAFEKGYYLADDIYPQWGIMSKPLLRGNISASSKFYWMKEHVIELGTTVTRVGSFNNNPRGFKFKHFTAFTARKFAETDLCGEFSVLISGKSSTVARLLSSVNISSGKIYTNSGKNTLAVGMNMTLAVGKYSSSGNEQDRFVSDAILFNNYWKDQLRRTIILEDVQGAQLECCFLMLGVTSSLKKPSVSLAMYSTKLYLNDELMISKKYLLSDRGGSTWPAKNVDDLPKRLILMNPLIATPVLDTAKSSRFSNVANIPFNIEESPKTADGTAKGNGTNANGKGSYNETENDGGDSGSGKRTIIDLDDFDEEAAIAKRNKKVIQAINDVIKQLSLEETKLDVEVGFGDVTGSGIYSSSLSHDESFGVDDLDLNVNLTLDLNVPQTETQEEALMSDVPNDHVVNELDTYVDVEPTVDVGRTEEYVVEHVKVHEVVDGSADEDVVHGSAEEDVEQCNGQEAVGETNGEQVDYDVDRIDSTYQTQYHVEYSEDACTNDDDDDLLMDEENEIVELDVNVHLFCICKDVPFNKIVVTSIVLEGVFEGEDVDVVTPDSFDSNTGYDNETKFGSSKEAEDIVYLHSIESIKDLKLYKNDKTRAFQDQLQRDLELKVSMSKAFVAKAKVKREVKGDHTLQYVMLRDYVVE
ncbi:serine/threonine-protein kinase ATR [Tanacetum coccineum]|uniref:Serine/threonine-protein kinase ATR n=1 Tax=Tanacetum coccineum TaxID=301880 RepID=A0ABQ4ZMZ0_9ASTR